MLYVGSAVAPPGEMGTRNSPTPASVSFSINSDVTGVYDACAMTFKFVPVTPNAPEISQSYGFCPDLSFPIDGPAGIGRVRFDVPSTVPEGAVYQLQLYPVPQGLSGKNGETLPVHIVPGVLLVRQKPMLLGDLDDSGAIGVKDAILSLRIAVGLEGGSSPSDPEQLAPYLRAAGDANRDGQLSVADTIQVLRWAVSADSPPV
jgi:hypothetical protein